MGRTNPDKNTTVVERWFIAVQHYIYEENLRGFKTFCEMYDLPRTTLARMEKEPHRHFHTEWLTLLVEKCGYSAHWLLTGKGPMIAEIKEKAQKENA